MKCVYHKTYKAIKHPSTNCFSCWLMWLTVHKDEQIVAGDLSTILSSLVLEITKTGN